MFRKFSKSKTSLDADSSSDKNAVKPIRRLSLPDDVAKEPTKEAHAKTLRMQKFLDSTRNFMLSQRGVVCLQSNLNEQTRFRRGSESGKSCLFDRSDRRMLHPVTLTTDQIAEYEGAFNKYDRNGDGSISVVELSVLLETIGLKPSEDEIAQMIGSVDSNSDGALSMSEFIKLMSRHHNPIITPQEQYEAIFRVFDADCNGIISRTEFKDTLFSIGQRCSEDELSALIAEIDVNRDGVISKREFLSIFLDHTSNPSR